MKRRIRFGGSNNLAISFEAMVKDLERIAEEKNVPVNEVIDDFISDLQNYNNTDYKAKLVETEITGEVSSELAKNCIAYLNKAKKRNLQLAKKKEQKNKRVEKQEQKEEFEKSWKRVEESIHIAVSEKNEGTESEVISKILEDIHSGAYNFEVKEKRYIVQKLKNRFLESTQREQKAAEELAKKEAAEELARKEAAEELARKEAQQAENQKRVTKIWGGIQQIANNGSREKDVKESQYWIAIRNNFVKQSSENEDVKNQILELIDKTIIEKEEDEYFEEVKYVTRGFKSLGFFSAEVMNAVYGTSTRKISKKNSERFYNLRKALQESNDEYKQIGKLLNDSCTSDGDRKILLARKEVIYKEKEREQRENIPSEER